MLFPKICVSPPDRERAGDDALRDDAGEKRV
jgi:hypothetical protein